MPREVMIHGRLTRIFEAEIDKDGRPRMGYIVSYPPGYAREHGPLPMLCFLHGSGEHAGNREITNAMTADDMHGPLKGGRACDRVDRFIVVAPQLPRGVWDAAHAGEVRRIVEGVAEGDPGRRFLTGFSSGGDGVLSIAAAPGTPGGFWAKAWPVDPIPVAANPGGPLWLSLGQRSRNRGFQALGLNPPPPNPPLDRATMTPDQIAAATAQAVAAAVNNPRVCVDEGQFDRDIDPATAAPFPESGHVRTATRAYQRSEIYDWLLA
jgi:hypothetical protein